MDYKDNSLASNDVVFLGARIRVEEDIAGEEVKVRKRFIRPIKNSRNSPTLHFFTQ